MSVIDFDSMRLVFMWLIAFPIILLTGCIAYNWAGDVLFGLKRHYELHSVMSLRGARNKGMYQGRARLIVNLK